MRADILVTAVRTKPAGGERDDSDRGQSGEAADRAPARHEGISFLIVEKGDGITARPLRKLGWHASDTAEIALHDVFVPAENLLGAEHGGFYMIMANFQWERLLMALGAIGAMQACFEQTVAYVLRDGRRPSQAVRHRLAEIAVEIEAGRDVTYAALRCHLAGQDAIREVTIAKLRTQRAAFDAIDACLGLHGLDAPAELERAVRDARLGPIGGGTDEIMKEILGRSLGL